MISSMNGGGLGGDVHPLDLGTTFPQGGKNDVHI